MIKVCKIRFYPNKSRINLINDTLNACRYVSNLYIEYNIKIYKETGEFLSGYDFAKIITKLKKTNPNYLWLNNKSTKAIKDSIMNTEKIFRNFFKKKGGFPHFKSRKRMSKESFFFIKDSIHYTDNKNIISIPILGKIRITEYDHLPDIEFITSGRVIKDLNKYYDMIIYNTNSKEVIKNNFGLGIDVGVKSYASIYNGKDSKQVKHFKDYERYKCLSKRIIKLQQVLSKKAEINYYRLLNAYIDKHEGNEPNEQTKNIMKGESYNSSNIRRIKSKIRRLFNKLRNIRKDYINKLVNMIVARTKPLFITIEDLSISNMISCEGQHVLHKYITESGFYYFKERLIQKCTECNIELRIADKYFASSKKCCICGHKNKNLTLSDRTFICPKCGNERDRDLNAAINLYNTKKYSIYA